MHGFMPDALNRNIAPGGNDPAIIPAGVDFHVAVSMSDSLRPYFDGPSGGIESHFYVRLDGTIEQYRSIFCEADAQSAGNSFGSPRRGFVSVETEGMGDGEWTDAQIDSLKRIVRWVHSEAPFALRVAPAWNAEGVGYHCLFDEWNPNKHSCPGPARVRQFNDIFVPWLRDGADLEEDDFMASPKAEGLLNQILRQVTKTGGLTYRRDKIIIRGVRQLADAIDALAAEAKNDAARGQVARVRADLKDLEQQLAAEAPGDEPTDG